MAALLAGIGLMLTGCSTGSQTTPRLRAYDHGYLPEGDFSYYVGTGEPRVGIDPRGSEIEEVLLVWGKAPLEYGGHFFYPEDDWVEANQYGSDSQNVNFRIWRSRFGKDDDLAPAENIPRFELEEGTRIDYRFRVKYRRQDSDTSRYTFSPARTVLVAPVNGRVQLVFDPKPAGQDASVTAANEITLKVRLNKESSIRRIVNLRTEPRGHVMFLDPQTDEARSTGQVRFEPEETYREITVRAVEPVNAVAPQQNPVTVHGESSGWLPGQTDLLILP